MDWQQKAEALASLTELAICFREKQWRIGGDEPWYVQQKIDIRDGCCLHGAYGNGYTPQEAIEDHWKRLVDDLSSDQYLVIEAAADKRRAVRWNGFMWQDMPEPKREAA